MSAQTADAVVVGAGPYGLSCAAHLIDAGVETRVFGYPMSAWRDHMPKGMFLKSTPEASSMSAPQSGSTLGDFCEESGIGVFDETHPLPRSVFVDYGLRFQQKYVAGLEQKAVEKVALAPDGFKVSVGGETINARSVVVASGHLRFAHIPDELRAAAPFVTHSSDHSDFAEFAGKTVAVVGAGQSALESAALLHEAGATVRLVVRSPAIVWGSHPLIDAPSLLRMAKPQSPMGPGWSLFLLSRAPAVVRHLPAPVRLYLMRSVLGPSGAWWLRDRFGPNIDVSLETTASSAQESKGKVTLWLQQRASGRKQIEVDHVIAATGYRIDLDAIDLLDPELRGNVARVAGSAAPRLSSSFESSVPGLYFVGLSAGPTFGPVLRFVCGSGFAARSVSAAIAGVR